MRLLALLVFTALFLSCSQKYKELKFLDYLSEEKRVESSKQFNIVKPGNFNKQVTSQGKVNFSYDVLHNGQNNRLVTSYEFLWNFNIRPKENADKKFIIDIRFEKFHLVKNLNGIIDRYNLDEYLMGEHLVLTIHEDKITDVQGSEQIVGKLLDNLPIEKGSEFANFFLPENIKRSFWGLFEPFFITDKSLEVAQTWNTTKFMPEINHSVNIGHKFNGIYKKADETVAIIMSRASYPGNLKIKTPIDLQVRNKYYYSLQGVPLFAERSNVYMDRSVAKTTKTTVVSSEVGYLENKE